MYQHMMASRSLPYQQATGYPQSYTYLTQRHPTPPRAHFGQPSQQLATGQPGYFYNRDDGYESYDARNHFPQPKFDHQSSSMAVASTMPVSRAQDPRVAMRQPERDAYQGYASIKTESLKVSQAVCDKCDGPHETDSCPHFKKAREKHPDAWESYTSSAGSSPRKPAGRQCNAPRVFASGSVHAVRMPGDGACLFHSLAHGLSVLGLEREEGLSVRNRIADFIGRNPDHCIAGTELKHWVEWDSNQTVQEYARTLAGGYLWGGAIEMRVFCHIWRVDLGVYQVSSGRELKRISDFAAEQKPRGTVLIIYSNGNHYDALVQARGTEATGDPHERYARGYGHNPEYSRYSRQQPNDEEEEESMFNDCVLM